MDDMGTEPRHALPTSVSAFDRHHGMTTRMVTIGNTLRQVQVTAIHKIWRMSLYLPRPAHRAPDEPAEQEKFLSDLYTPDKVTLKLNAPVDPNLFRLLTGLPAASPPPVLPPVTPNPLASMKQENDQPIGLSVRATAPPWQTSSAEDIIEAVKRIKAQPRLHITIGQLEEPAKGFWKHVGYVTERPDDVR